MTEGTTVTTTHYLDGFQYIDDKMEFFPTAEGYVKVTHKTGGTAGGGTTASYNYVFNYTDHPRLREEGNIRLRYALNEDNWMVILEEDHYYPFGLKHQGYNAENYVFISFGGGPVQLIPTNPNALETYKYKYQEQERQDELGLNWDSFKWRNYDYAIGRFMSIDPLAEKYAYQSVYQFASNQPIHAKEIEGLENSFDLNMRSYTAEKLSDRGHGSLKENYSAIQQAEQRGSEIAVNGALVVVAALTPIPGDEAVAASLLLKTGVATLDVASQVAAGGDVDLVGPAMNFAPLGSLTKEAVDAVIDINPDGTISTPFGSTNDQAKTTSEVLIDFTAGMVSNKTKSQVPNELKNTSVGNIISEAVLTGAENISGQLLKDNIEDEEHKKKK